MGRHNHQKQLKTQNKCPVCEVSLGYYRIANLTIEYAGLEFCSDFCFELWLDEMQANGKGKNANN